MSAGPGFVIKLMQPDSLSVSTWGGRGGGFLRWAEFGDYEL